MEEERDFQARLMACINTVRKRYLSFDESFISYTAQYGEPSVRVYEPFRISGTIDPVTIILGHTTPVFYRDSKRTLGGTLGSVALQADEIYILGRRRSSDSKLVVWSLNEETEIENYNSTVRIIPSRIHAAIFASKNDVVFADLGSSSGSVLVGESSKLEPFISVYSTTDAGIHRTTIPSKYPVK